MKFVHIADMHFDSPFATLSDKGNLGEQRRLEQRKIFKKIIEYIKTKSIEAKNIIYINIWAMFDFKYTNIFFWPTIYIKGKITVKKIINKLLRFKWK